MKINQKLKRRTIASLYRSRAVLGGGVDALAGRLFNKGRKRFISPDIPVKRFFEILAERKVEYVVLRWFEDLPKVEPGHDLDLLVADGDLHLLDDLVGYWPLGQEVDIYSETGRPGFDYAPWYVKPKAPHAMAVFPPHLSRRLLGNAVLKDGLVRVPDERDHLFSLAYHAIYLKGVHSGLVSRDDPRATPRRASHDYAAILSGMAARAGIDLPASPRFEDLDDMLGAHGWRPPLDTLERIAAWAPWVRARYFGGDAPDDGPRGVAVFLIRQKAVDLGLKQDILDMIEARGFELLETKDLCRAGQERLSAETRGGNWGRGPYGSSGGPPACAVVVLDVLPSALREDLAPYYPLLENARILHAKTVIRKIVNRGLAPEETFNALHSTDSHRQGWEMTRSLFPDRIEQIRATVAQRQAQFDAHAPGLVDLTSFGNRSRVDLVPWGDGHAVRKVFKPHFTRLLHREVAVLRAMAHSPHMPRLLEVGDDYLVVEHFQDLWRDRPPKRLPLPVVRQLSAFFRDCAAHGYDPIDLTTRNLIMDRTGGLKVIDFEFWHDRGRPYPPEEAYALRGVPKDFEGEYPVGSAHIFDPYRTEWYPFVGMSLDDFLAAGSYRDRMSRAMNFPLIEARRSAMPALLKALHRPVIGHLVFGVPKRARRLYGRIRSQ